MVYCLLAINFATPNISQAKTLNIITDIAPVRAIVDAVVADLQDTQQLIVGSFSPHDFALKPSDIRKLQKADLIVWSGPMATAGLAKLMQRPEFAQKGLALNSLPDTQLHYLRSAVGEQNVGTDNEIDPHAWLDPQNAHHWAIEISRRLQQFDADNASKYSTNVDQFTKKLAAQSAEIRERFSSKSVLPYFQYHDAFQYFETAFGLAPLGFATSGDEGTTSLGVLTKIRSDLGGLDRSCIFSPAHMQENAAQVFGELSGVELGIVDPLGAILPDGFDYLQLISSIADAFAKCLLRSS